MRLLELPALPPSGATNATSRPVRNRCLLPIRQSRMARDVGLHLRPSTQKIISACLLSVLFRLLVPIRLLASAYSTKFKILCVRLLALCIRLVQSDQNMFNKLGGLPLVNKLGGLTSPQLKECPARKMCWRPRSWRIVYPGSPAAPL